jgi:methylase of polypeptide subunit release factors
MTTQQPVTSWKTADEVQTARWRSESGTPAPASLHPVDDRLPASTAYGRIRSGEFLLYTGDYRNAQQLLRALGRRLERLHERDLKNHAPASLADAFHAERRARLREHDFLSRVLVPLDASYRLELKHAPDVAEMCRQIWGPPDAPRTVVALRELLGMIGASEWRKKGVPVRALGGERIYPYYGVFAPTRQEYLELVAAAPFPERVERAFDIGTGTGVLALVLAARGAQRVVATDQDPRAVACARENVAKFKATGRVEVLQADLFPEGTADLVICNPPWIPAQPRTPMDRAIFDPDSRFLNGFLSGLRAHLTARGQGWLVLSNLAELLGLRPEGALEQAFSQAGLGISWTREAQPKHPKAYDKSDPLHAARSRERTRLFCLVPA